MKLSEVVDYLRQLEQIDLDPTCTTTARYLDSVMHTVASHPIQRQNLTGDLQKDLDDIKSTLSKFQCTISNIKEHLSKIIKQQEPAMYQESSRLYEEEMCFETSEYILNRSLAIDEESNILLRSRLRNASDWRLPGMIIRPGRESFIEDLVPLDPLYLVDHNQELLDPSILKFTAEYQRRLRPYVVKEYHSNIILELLPDNQFGLIFAYNYFNYKPLEVIHRYLQEVFKKLRPGGTFIFTFNDCDYSHCVALAERHFMCYTPGHAIQTYAENIGYECIHKHHGAGDLNWLELCKPGEIKSIRGGQSLARIVAKSK